MRRTERGLVSKVLGAIVAVLGGYFLVAYVLVPWVWKEHEGPVHPALDSVPKVTHSADGIPGDPLNVGLVGSTEELVHAMLAVAWKPADPITFDTSIGIAKSVLFERPDPDAPVSPLFVFGRKQDLAFEREAGSSADKRHHVRWWKTEQLDDGGRPFWIGDASFDKDSGVSHLTGQITHHIDADVDAQRDQLMGDLREKNQLEREYQVMGVGPTQDGRNAGGDRYYTDGMVSVGVLAVEPGANDGSKR